MWMCSCNFLRQSLTPVVRCNPKSVPGLRACLGEANYDELFGNNRFSSSGGASGGGGDGGEHISYRETKKLMRLVNVEALKANLGMEGNEVISYSELLKTCKSIGIAKSADEATAFARVLDDTDVVLLFRDQVYLYPDKVVDLVKNAVPLALLPKNNPCKDELKKLQKKKSMRWRISKSGKSSRPDLAPQSYR